MFHLGTPELLLLCGLGILLFGKKLPEIARSLGKSVVSFKQGLQGVEDEIDQATVRAEKPAELPRLPQRLTPETPKFSEPATNSTTV